MKKYLLGLLFSLLSLFGLSAQAAIDTAAAVAGIADVGIALAAIIAALMAMALSIYGINAVYKFINRKSGS